MQACQNHGRTRVNRTEQNRKRFCFGFIYCEINHHKVQWFKIETILSSLVILWVDWAQSGSSKASCDVSWAEIIWKCFGWLSHWLGIMAGTCRSLNSPGMPRPFFLSMLFQALSLSLHKFWEMWQSLETSYHRFYASVQEWRKSSQIEGYWNRLGEQLQWHFCILFVMQTGKLN